jgi:hypothetical protein
MNHHAGCTCGFGGYGHLGQRGSGFNTNQMQHGAEYWWVPPITQTYQSYIYPNAFCPVCDAQVFFYQSPNGGRVFFDELGPPWRKHPCTDNRSIPKNKAIIIFPSFLLESISKYSWQKSGWHPYFMSAVSGIDNLILKISGTFNDEELTLYIKRITNPHGQYGEINPIAKESIAHIKKITEQTYEMSLITVFGKSINVIAFTSLIEARDNARLELSPNSVSSNGNLSTKMNKLKSTKSTLNKQNTQSLKDQVHNTKIAPIAAKDSINMGARLHPNKQKIATAMTLAFEKAFSKQNKVK